MLLISPPEAAAAIGAKCGGSSPSADDAALVSILGFVTTRVEDALDVYSLTLCESYDKFRVKAMPAMNSRRRTDPEPRLSLRLSNGFVVVGSIVVIDPFGAEIDLETLADVDYEVGVINLSSWSRGTYKVTYHSGFEPEAEPVPVPLNYDEDGRVLLLVPDWIKAIAIGALVTWYRTMFLQPKGGTAKDLAHRSISDAIYKEIMARIYKRYLRPRMDVVFAERREYGT